MLAWKTARNSYLRNCFPEIALSEHVITIGFIQKHSKTSFSKQNYLWCQIHRKCCGVSIHPITASMLAYHWHCRVVLWRWSVLISIRTPTVLTQVFSSFPPALQGNSVLSHRLRYDCWISNNPIILRLDPSSAAKSATEQKLIMKIEWSCCHSTLT
jgi:hypothetical protein